MNRALPTPPVRIAKPRYILLDRDGVINRRVPEGYVTSWKEFEFLPGALDALRLLAHSGYVTLVVSNQACVGKGLLSGYELDAITRRFLVEVEQAGGNIAKVYYCCHTAKDRCTCRKPQPGLIEFARSDFGFAPHETFLVGDSPADVAAAAAAGCPSILLRRDFVSASPVSWETVQAAVPSLLEAAQYVIAAHALPQPDLAEAHR